MNARQTFRVAGGLRQRPPRSEIPERPQAQQCLRAGAMVGAISIAVDRSARAAIRAAASSDPPPPCRSAAHFWQAATRLARRSPPSSTRRTPRLRQCRVAELGRTWLTGTPSVSAATCVITVYVPVPMSASPTGRRSCRQAATARRCRHAVRRIRRGCHAPPDEHVALLIARVPPDAATIRKRAAASL
jgi:hypothetical protein